MEQSVPTTKKKKGYLRPIRYTVRHISKAEKHKYDELAIRVCRIMDRGVDNNIFEHGKNFFYFRIFDLQPFRDKFE